MSQRHEPDDDLLDAVRACVMAVGVRRTTLTDVARRAGVSRMTVYRRFPDVAALLQALMTREFGALVVEIAGGPGDRPTARERFVASVVAGADRLASDPLFRRILDVDPELMLPYLVQRYGAFQHVALDALAAQIERARDGSFRDGDPRLLAATVELLLRGWVFSALAEPPPGGRPAALEQIAATLDRGLAP
jgi:AcrR family transcriptional regulator